MLSFILNVHFTNKTDKFIFILIMVWLVNL